MVGPWLSQCEERSGRVCGFYWLALLELHPRTRPARASHAAAGLAGVSAPGDDQKTRASGVRPTNNLCPASASPACHTLACPFRITALFAGELTYLASHPPPARDSRLQLLLYPPQQLRGTEKSRTALFREEQAYDAFRFLLQSQSARIQSTKTPLTFPLLSPQHHLTPACYADFQKWIKDTYPG